MKKIFLILAASMFAVMTNAQNLLSLDNYSIPLNQKGAKVGRFLVSDPGQVSLVKDNSGLFEIDKNGNLNLKKNKTVQPGTPVSYDIVVRYNGKDKLFTLVKNELISNKVVAHRGAWKHTGMHQNSLGALKKAVELGCEASEFDVWLSKDGRVALNHDKDINGLIVEETDLNELQKITLKNNEIIPTLEDYINYIKTQNKTRLVLEIKSNKNGRAIALADSCVNIVHRMAAQAWVDYISFDYDALLRVRTWDAGTHIAYLQPDVPMDLQKVNGVNGIDYNHSHFSKIERLYDRAKVLGLTVNVWTVNNEKLIHEFLDLNVDWITTDEPELLLKLIEERKIK